MKKRYMIAEIHGMCGGVFSALKTIDQLIADHPGQVIYVLHELVHNTAVTAELEARNVRFIRNPDELPPDSIALIGAHGVSAEVEAQLRSRAALVADATCPLVKKLHRAAAEAAAAKEMILLLGHPGHPEVEGILGQAEPGRIHLLASPEETDLPEPAPGQPIRFLTQTTLDTAWVERAEERLRQHYGNDIRMETGICYATRDRQNAVRRLAERSDLVIVAGSPRSSNSNRLREVAAEITPSVLIDTPEEIDSLDLRAIRTVGLTAGASVPDELTGLIRCRLHQLGYLEG